MTRLLVLREFHGNPRATLREVGDRLGVTVQAVSSYAKSLQRDGLLASGRGHHEVTPGGMQALQEGLQELRRAIDDALAPLAVIRVASAVAGTRIRAGERVGLFMEDGDVTARTGAASPSTGRAAVGGEPGEEVLVGDLSGFIDLKPGRVVLVRVPGPSEGGARGIAARRVVPALKAEGIAFQRVGAHGTGAKVLARRAGLEIDFEFAAPHAAFNAAECGLDVLLLVTRDRLKEALAVLDDLNSKATHSRVPVEVRDGAIFGGSS